MNKRTSTTANRFTLMIAASLLGLAAACNTSQAYQRYNSGCQNCHGAFTGNTSPQGTAFPSGDKHRMHRNSANMGTSCVLCHTTGDGDDPYIGSSDGVTGGANPITGMGCSGCHVGSGLRRHHAATGTTACYGSATGCHGTVPETAPAENVFPYYYGKTTYTKCNNPGNTALVSNTNENWSVGDFIGLDNDGNNLYDVADFAIGGRYQILSTTKEGNNVRITWQTAGGRRDVLQVSGVANGSYSNLSSTISNAGVGMLTTNYLDVGALTSKPQRYYRVANVP